jgi:hypothetical protein
MVGTSGQIRLKMAPDRIFVSVDKDTGRSAISFAPSEAGAPISYEGDSSGSRAMSEAKAISEAYPGSTIHGPHFHAARSPAANGRKRMTRKPPAKKGGDE